MPLLAAEIDESMLPSAATNRTEFARDIKPIFEVSCIRCHGPEKPKSGFRLDSREAALKGGENGVDIQPGNSAKSPLIHYVARLVPDLEMPPEGKGQPLTKDQIGLLRAWIDQGAVWEEVTTSNAFDLAISPMVGGTFVSGDKRKFREERYRREGVDQGLESFDLFEQSDPDTKVTSNGHALLNDYKVALQIDRNDRGFIHAGWEQYRRYYDDTGGYFPGPKEQVPESLGSDLHMDLGKAWVDFGLTLPHWPRIVVGYEYDYRRGEEATTSFQFDGVRTDPRNIAPASKRVEEGTHVIKFDLEAEVHGVTIEDRFRGEFYKLDTVYTNVAARDGVTQNAREANTYFQGANSIRLEKKFKDWLFGSGGYFYSKLNADDLFTNVTVNGGTPYVAAVPQIALERESHIFNLNGLLGPFHGLSLSVGAQSEWTRQQGLGSGELNGIAFTKPPNSNFSISPATLASDYQQNTISETVGLHYTKIPFTALFADARLRQETISQSDSDIQADGSFLENPSFTSDVTDLRAGFNTSPWQSVSLTADYHRYEDDSHYRTNQVPQPLGGYPGFISARDLLTDEYEAKLVLRPSPWLKLNLSYQLQDTDYKEDTRSAFSVVPPIGNYSAGGTVLSGKEHSQIYSVGMTLSPHRRLFLSTTVSYQKTSLTTVSDGLVPPYKGDIYSALISGTYIIGKATDLLLSYSLSLADYSQENAPQLVTSPPPLGIRYQQHAVQVALSHRFNRNLSTRIQYGYFYYDEPPAAGANNYKAHSLFASLTYHFR